MDRPCPSSRPSRLSRHELAVIGLAMAIAALVTGFHLGHESLWLDEAFSLNLVSQSWAGLWQFLAAQEVNMIAYHLLLKLWVAYGDSEAFVRALSALFAVATIPVQYLLARRLGGSRVAGLAALLLATNLFFVRYAQEARAYALVCFFSALSAWLLLRALAEPKWQRWLAYALSGALLLHCHILGALILLAQGAGVVLFQPKSAWTGAVMGYLGLAGLSLPLGSFFIRHRNAGNVNWVPRPSVHGVAVVLHDLSGMFGMTALYLLGAALAIGTLRRPSAPLPKGAATAALWFALPVGGLLAESLLLRPLFISQYLIGTLPALTIFVAFGLASIERRGQKWLALIWLPACAASLSYWYLLPQKEDWRSALANLSARSQPGDGLLVLPPYLRPEVDYYLRYTPGASDLAPVFPAVPWGHSCEWEYFKKQVLQGTLDTKRLIDSGRRRLWVLSTHEMHTPDPRLPPLLQALVTHGYRESTQSFYQVDVQLFER